MTIENAFDEFLRFKRRQGLSPRSLICYNSFVSRFLDFIGPSVPVSDIKEVQIQDYIDTLFRLNISRSTRATYIRHMKVFLNWIKKYHDIDLFTSRIIVPKAQKRICRIYDDDDIHLIFSCITAENEWITARNCAMVALMLDSGLRQGEVCSLRTSDIFFNDMRIKVCGKGGKERIVPLGNFSLHYMREYRRLCPYEKEYFFISRRGRAVTCDAVKHLIYKINEKLPFEFSSHKLRHNFATNYCLDQYEKYGIVDIYKLMILMGHDDVKTTDIYLHIANSIIASRENISHLDRIFP